MTDTFNILCMSCGEPTYATADQARELVGCPKCGDKGTPADLDDTINVILTAHELRVLTFWADGYARMVKHAGQDEDGRMGRVLTTIRDRLAMQTDTPLSLGQELADVRKHFTDRGFENGIEVTGLVAIDANGDCVDCGESVDIDKFYEHECEITMPEEEA